MTLTWTWTSRAPQIFGGIWEFIQILIWGKFEAMTFGIREVPANPTTFPHYQVFVQIEIALHNFRYFKAFSRLKCFRNPACLWLLPPPQKSIKTRSGN